MCVCVWLACVRFWTWSGGGPPPISRYLRERDLLCCHGNHAHIDPWRERGWMISFWPDNDLTLLTERRSHAQALYTHVRGYLFYFISLYLFICQYDSLSFLWRYVRMMSDCLCVSQQGRREEESAALPLQVSWSNCMLSLSSGGPMCSTVCVCVCFTCNVFVKPTGVSEWALIPSSSWKGIWIKVCAWFFYPWLLQYHGVTLLFEVFESVCVRVYRLQCKADTLIYSDISQGDTDCTAQNNKKGFHLFLCPKVKYS